MGKNAANKGKKGIEKSKAEEVTRTGLSQKIMGDNSLQGDNQVRVRNERHAVPDALEDASDVIESFEKVDKNTRARTDLGKGSRSRD